MYLSDIYTITANLAGIPGLSIPCGLTKSNLPIGLQLLAPAFAEETAAPDGPGLRAGDRLAPEEAGAGMMAERILLSSSAAQRRSRHGLAGSA